MKNVNNIFRLPCEPRRRVSCGDHHTRLIEYDDRMRQEAKKYSRLLTELNNSRWMNLSHLRKNHKLDDMTPHDIDQTTNEDQSAHPEPTRLSGDEILHGSGLTMEQALLEHQKFPFSLMETTQNAGSDFVESSAKESVPRHSTMVIPGKFSVKGRTGVCSSRVPVLSRRNQEKYANVYSLYQETQKRNEG